MNSSSKSKNTMSDLNISMESQKGTEETVESENNTKKFRDILYDLRSYKKLSESDLKFVEQLNHNDKNELIRIYNLVLESALDICLNFN